MAHPDRLVINDRVNEMFGRIYHDIEDGVAPIDDFGDMFRDFSGDATEDYGQFFLAQCPSPSLRSADWSR